MGGEIPDAFRALMATFPSGVAVLTTTATDGSPLGMTCTAICSVSLEPPIVLASLANGGRTLDGVLRTGSFCLNFLHEGAVQSARDFARSGPDKFAGITWRPSLSSGDPCLDEYAHAIAELDVHRADEVGDHTVVYGLVRQVQVHHAVSRIPLLYGMHRFESFPVWSGEEACA